MRKSLRESVCSLPQRQIQQRTQPPYRLYASLFGIGSARVLLLSLVLATCVGCYVGVPFEGMSTGTNVPELPEGVWLSGEETTLAELRGSKVLLEFWSIDCPPCRARIPEMKRYHEQSAETGYRVITVHMNLRGDSPASEADIRRVIELSEIDYPVLIDTEESSWARYEFDHLPHAILVSEDGNVIWSGNLVAYELGKRLATRSQ